MHGLKTATRSNTPSLGASMEPSPRFVNLSVVTCLSGTSTSTACSIRPPASEQNGFLHEREVSARLDEFLASQPESLDGLIRICLFDGLLGFPAPRPFGRQPGERPTARIPASRTLAKSTAETQLYGRLSELSVATEDWILIDPEGRDLRESATSNLIFARRQTIC